MDQQLRDIYTLSYDVQWFLLISFESLERGSHQIVSQSRAVSGLVTVVSFVVKWAAARDLNAHSPAFEGWGLWSIIANSTLHCNRKWENVRTVKKRSMWLGQIGWEKEEWCNHPSSSSMWSISSLFKVWYLVFCFQSGSELPEISPGFGLRFKFNTN